MLRQQVGARSSPWGQGRKWRCSQSTGGRSSITEKRMRRSRETQMSRRGQRTRAMKPYSQISPKRVAYITLQCTRSGLSNYKVFRGEQILRKQVVATLSLGMEKEKTAIIGGSVKIFKKRNWVIFFSIKKKQLL